MLCRPCFLLWERCDNSYFGANVFLWLYVPGKDEVLDKV